MAYLAISVHLCATGGEYHVKWSNRWPTSPHSA